MAKLTRRQLDEEIKLRFLGDVSEHLENMGEEVLRVKATEIALPVVDSEGNETYLVITFKVPTGTRQGEAYDGHAEAENYAHDLAEKAKKKAENEAKAARDRAKREAKAKEKETEE